MKMPRVGLGTGQATLRLHVGLAAVAYVPLLLTRPGWISADTKTYLYLDPGQLMSRAWSMWDPSVGAGTVTHQTIGYLWPMAPFYWLADALGLPDWAAQRIWWGTIIFAAGAGVAYLLRVLGWRGPGLVTATFVYALTPYLLTLVARLSAILLPFSALPWLLAFTVQTVRHKGWRYPALFALVVATCGSVNATALLLVGLAPLLWLVHSVWGSGEASLRTAVRAALRIGVLTVPVSLWWIAGLSVQGTHGIDILRYTETAKVVGSVSVSHEVLRGLGYWFFYGADRLGPWIEPSTAYTQWLPLIAISYLVPLLGIGGAVVARWRHRAYFVLLTVVGTALAVGAYPWDEGPPFARIVQAFQGSEAGLAMRSLPRAAPLVVLGLAVLLGAGVASVVRRWPRLGRPVGWGGVALAVLTLPALWLGQFVPDNLRRREDIPSYWEEAADHLDSRGDRSDQTRVLVVPGSDFASYRWGNTVDPILPGLMDRPSLQRELIPYGSPASANLLNALDLTFQERTADPDALAAIARLLRAGDVVVQSDLQYERYNLPRPRNFWELVQSAPGLGEPTAFGPGEPNRTVEEVQLDDELLLLTDPSLPDPPEVAVLPVEDAVPIVNAQSTANPLLVAGDGSGLVDAAGAGLLDGTELVRYSASLDADEIADALDEGAALLLTDSNRKRGERWTTVRHTRGYTESADSGQLEPDLGDNRLPVFPDAATDTMSVSQRDGDVDAEATSYGNPITFSPDERPIYAVDGDPETAWRTAGFLPTAGERLELTLSHRETADGLRLLQPIEGPATRFITRVRLRFDGGDPVDVELTDESRREPGQVVRFPRRTFETLSIEILDDSKGWLPRYVGQTSVGFGEVEVLGTREELDQDVVEGVRLPTDLLEAAGTQSIDRPLAVLLTRLRQDATDPTRDDEERAIVRSFELPRQRSFNLSGTARLSGRADPELVDALLGRQHGGAVPWVRARDDLTGGIVTPAAAFDGDPATAWTTVRSRPRGQWVEVMLPQPVTIDHLPLTVVADGLHSVPTEIELWVDGRPLGERLTLPRIADGEQQNATTEVDLTLPQPVTGSRFGVKITGVREVRTNDWVSDRSVAQSAAIAEIGLPGPRVPPLPAQFDTGCRADLLSVDDRPVPVRVSGTTADALAGKPLPITPCEGELMLDGGLNSLQATRGVDTAIDIDQLLLRSAPSGGASTSSDTLVAEAVSAAPVTAPPSPSAPGSASASTSTTGEAGGTGTATGEAGETATTQPRVRVTDDGLDHVDVEVRGATPDEPFWLVLGQSHNTGWTATVDGEPLAEPELVDGFANGWLVVPTDDSFSVELRFTPQQRVNWALWVSVLAAVGCLVLAVRRPRRATVAPSAMPEPYSHVLAFRYHGALPSRRTAWLAGLAVGAVAWALAGPLIGVGVGAAAGIGTRHEKFRRWLLLASPVALSLAAAWVLYLQFRHSPEPGFDWPLETRRPHPLGWLAVLLLAADVIVGRIWQSRSTEVHDG